MAEDLERFKLPMKWKPGHDVMSKMLLSDPEIIPIIIHSLLGVDVSPDSYSVAPTECVDGSRSELVYASTQLPPILIEVQDQVNQKFMLSLISYASNVYRRYNELPVVLVIVTKSFYSAKFQEEFTVSADGLLLETVCKLWAKKCFFLTADAVSNHFENATLNPMAALGYFITRHTMRHVPRQHWRDPTLALVSRIADDVLVKEDDDMRLKSNTRFFLRNVKRNLEEIIENSKNQETSSERKTIINAEEGLVAIKQFEKDLEDDKPTQYTTEDAAFIEALSKPGKRRRWGEIFAKGKANGLFKSYKSPDTLKSSYYHIQKRNKASNE
ncbi:hypothetical protein MFLAVUS_008406 [Mucor flavus]|uniref:Uncharacterized protein n=1 Tax=Mucor flavus TaxID=439312 RepID=A0ABP9Z6Z3_9FUNG